VNPLRGSIEALTGHQATDEVIGKLTSLAEWLVTEAIPQGGLGPNEATDVLNRHIVGSVAFSLGFPQPPSVCWDLGTGVGLPGLVLAVLWPNTRMVLIDRSQKRCDLARRASRIIDVAVEVENTDLEELDPQTEAIVSRATKPASRLLPILERLLAPGGVAVVSGSKETATTPFLAITIPKGVLDPPPRLLMMRQP
jgi:16S rRNA (guanine527-N7)-methyltransferase